jgi:hypothetical protein
MTTTMQKKPIGIEPTAQYIVTNLQRERVFSHVVGLVIYVDALNDWAEDNRPYDGVGAMEVFYAYADQYRYTDVLNVFTALLGDPYADFISYWNKLSPLRPRTQQQENQQKG